MVTIYEQVQLRKLAGVDVDANFVGVDAGAESCEESDEAGFSDEESDVEVEAGVSDGKSEVKVEVGISDEVGVGVGVPVAAIV